MRRAPSSVPRWARAAWTRTLGRWRVYRVSGHSMTPTLAEGDWLLVDSYVPELPQPGELVVFTDPVLDQLLVKRVISRAEKTFAVGSDEPWESRDSRHFGSLSSESLVGRVARVKRFGSRGRREGFSGASPSDKAEPLSHSLSRLLGFRGSDRSA